jgi:hypothetical protein
MLINTAMFCGGVPAVQYSSMQQCNGVQCATMQCETLPFSLVPLQILADVGRGAVAVVQVVFAFLFYNFLERWVS